MGRLSVKSTDVCAKPMNTNYYEQDTTRDQRNEPRTRKTVFQVQKSPPKRGDVWFGGLHSPYRKCAKIKRFFSQIKFIGKFTFLKIIKFTIFCKGKLLFSKLLFTALTHIVRFSTRPVNIQWVLGELVQNSRFHQALTLCLFGVRSQPRCLKLSDSLLLEFFRLRRSNRAQRDSKQHFFFGVVSAFLRTSVFGHAPDSFSLF